MDTPTIRRLRSEWQTIGTTPQSSAAGHRLAQCEPMVARLQVGNLAARLNGPWSRIDTPQPLQEGGGTTLPDDAGMGPDLATVKFPLRRGATS
jgi:hypothetical protein